MSDSGPLVSAIIPTKNRASRIRRTIDSVLRQSFSDFELLVVDDGSTDDTEAVARAVADPRIRYMKKGPPHGPAAARNYGAAQARGEFIAFNDCGDEWAPEKLEVQVAAIRKLPEGTAMVYSSLARVFEGGKTQPLDCPVFHHDEEGVYRRALGMGVSGIYPQTCLIRTDVFRALGGFDETLRCWEDLEFFFRLAKSYRFDFTPGYLSLLHDDSRGVSANLDNLYDAHRRILEKYKGDLGSDPELLIPHYRGAGRQLIPSRHRDYARKLLKDVARSPLRQPGDFAFLFLAYAGAPVYALVRRARRLWWAARGGPPPLDANGGIGL